MFEKVKRELRVSTDAFDEDIADLIEAAKQDLQLVGITKIEYSDPLINRAVRLYCKGNFNLESKDSKNYIQSYELLKAHLSLAGDYSE